MLKMLPEFKNDFPKCLYLDLNKWIDLARAHHGKSEGVKFQQCLESVRAAVNSGKLIVPFDVCNAIESMISGDKGQRKRLAEFMVDLSGNKTVSPEYVVAPMEIVNATRQLFGMAATEAPRKSLVHVGIIHAIGMGREFQDAFPPILNAACSAFMGTPEATIKFLLDAGDKRDQIKAARGGEARARDIFESDRAVTGTMSLVERQREELFGLLSKNDKYRTALETTLKAIGRTGAGFKAEMGSDEKLKQFVASIPNFDVFITLRIEREKDKDRKVDHNDIRDLDWLSVAVPYSNIVVSERYWGKKVLANGLATKYGTVLLTNLQELPAHLSGMGCID
jgi:hypothetical protein